MNTAHSHYEIDGARNEGSEAFFSASNVFVLACLPLPLQDDHQRRVPAAAP